VDLGLISVDAEIKIFEYVDHDGLRGEVIISSKKLIEAGKILKDCVEKRPSNERFYLTNRDQRLESDFKFRKTDWKSKSRVTHSEKMSHG